MARKIPRRRSRPSRREGVTLKPRRNSAARPPDRPPSRYYQSLPEDPELAHLNPSKPLFRPREGVVINHLRQDYQPADYAHQRARAEFYRALEIYAPLAYDQLVELVGKGLFQFGADFAAWLAHYHVSPAMGFDLSGFTRDVIDAHLRYIGGGPFQLRALTWQFGLARSSHEAEALTRLIQEDVLEVESFVRVPLAVEAPEREESRGLRVLSELEAEERIVARFRELLRPKLSSTYARAEQLGVHESRWLKRETDVRRFVLKHFVRLNNKQILEFEGVKVEPPLCPHPKWRRSKGSSYGEKTRNRLRGIDISIARARTALRLSNHKLKPGPKGPRTRSIVVRRPIGSARN